MLSVGIEYCQLIFDAVFRVSSVTGLCGPQVLRWHWQESLCHPLEPRARGGHTLLRAVGRKKKIGLPGQGAESFRGGDFF